MTIPSILKNFNAFLNGDSFGGVVESATLPELKIKTESYRGGGMDAEVEIDMGMDAMTAKISSKELKANLIALWGLADGNAVRLTLRGALVNDRTGVVTAAVAEIGGGIKGLTFGEWKAGDPSSNDFELRVNYFRFALAGVDLIEIDVENMIRRVNGVDQLAAIRDAIAI